MIKWEFRIIISPSHSHASFGITARQGCWVSSENYFKLLAVRQMTALPVHIIYTRLPTAPSHITFASLVIMRSLSAK